MSRAFTEAEYSSGTYGKSWRRRRVVRRESTRGFLAGFVKEIHAEERA